MIQRKQIVLADADNTLWDTDAVFAGAQLELLANVEMVTGRRCGAENRLTFLREYDQALAAKHHLHLRYPPMMLVTALAAGLMSMPANDVADAIIRGRALPVTLSPNTIDTIVSRFVVALGKAPALLPGVPEGLELARDKGVLVYVLTEGRAEKQRGIIVLHQLGGLLAGVSEVTKNEPQFSRLKKRYAPSDVYVIGDQTDRDIVPARAAHCITILVPSRFKPKWQDDDDWRKAHFVATDFLEAMTWIVQREHA